MVKEKLYIVNKSIRGLNEEKIKIAAEGYFLHIEKQDEYSAQINAEEVSFDKAKKLASNYLCYLLDSYKKYVVDAFFDDPRGGELAYFKSFEANSVLKSWGLLEENYAEASDCFEKKDWTKLKTLRDKL